MKPDTLKLRISECIDDLGLLLDCIYKFSQKNRENYFQRIQTMKNKLLSLRNSLSLSNLTLIEKQYKQIYLATNTLKNQIQIQQSSLNSKENREGNRCQNFKQYRKTHEETMKLLVDKEQEIKELKLILIEKDDQLAITEQELNTLKKNIEALLDERRLEQYGHDSLEIEIERSRALVMRYESDLLDIKIREEEKDKAFNNAIQELEKLKLQLIQANQKIIDLEYAAEVNIQKMIQAQAGSKKAEMVAKDLHSDCFRKENDSLSKLREIGQLQLSLKTTTDLLYQQEQKNRHLRQDIQVLENQVKKMEKQIVELKDQCNKEKEILVYEKQLVEKENSNGVYRQSELKRQLDESQKRYRIVIGKLNEAEKIRTTLYEVQDKYRVLQEQKEVLKKSLEKAQHQISILTKENHQLLTKIQNQNTAIRESQVQVFRMREKIRIKDDQIRELANSLQGFKGKIREYQKQLSSRDRREKNIETSLHEEKERLVKMEEHHRAKNKQLQTLKVKLFRAKIETIHQIRKSISQ